MKIEKETELIAKALAKKETGDEDLWELFLTLAYNKVIFPKDRKRYGEEMKNVKEILTQIMRG